MSVGTLLPIYLNDRDIRMFFSLSATVGNGLNANTHTHALEWLCTFGSTRHSCATL